MEARRLCILVALLALLVSLEVATVLAQADGNGNGNLQGNNGNGNGNGNGDDNNGNGNGNGNLGANNGNGNGNGNEGGNNGNGNGNGNAGGNNGNSNGNGNGNGDGDSQGNVGDGNGNGDGDSQGNGNGNAGGNNGNGNGNGDGDSQGNVGDGNGNGDGNSQGNVGDGNGNGDGQGNSGNGNGNGGGKGSSGNGNGNGNGNGDGQENNGQKRTRAPAPVQGAAGSYRALSPDANSVQERGYCLGVGGCQFKTLTCPAECPERKPKKNRRHKGCFLDCSSRCQATCKWRKPDCNEYGSICYDPRFVGGDGVMFYFHGSKGNDFAVVSDEKLHINAHFIGNRPQGRTRDFTWVQAVSVMFDANTLVLAANRVSRWNDKVDALIVKWNGDSIHMPTGGDAEWKTGRVVIERTVDVNTVRATVSGLVQIDVRVTPIGEKENRVHHYQLPSDDAFAHLEVQFRFFNLSEGVEGVLGKTYRAGYVSPVKRGVPMPIMGGEDKYRTPSLYSPSCKLCIFQRPQPAIAVV